MKATTLARLIEECDNHALTDYYYFNEVEEGFETLGMYDAFGLGPTNIKVEAGMYLIFYSDENMEEYKGILKRTFEDALEDYIYYKDENMVVLKIQD